MKSNYLPEIDITKELGEAESSYYQSLIGVLRWIVELGRVDICCKVSMLSSHLALPRCGHLAQVLHMVAYLKSHANYEMVYDPSDVEFDRAQFLRKDWGYSIYTQDDRELVEELPPNMPDPRGLGMTMGVYVDSDHAGDTVMFMPSTRGSGIFGGSSSTNSLSS